MKKFRLLLVIAFMGYGIWGIADALLHPKPMTIDCAEYVDSRPNSARHHYRDPDSDTSPPRNWIELTDCEIDIAGIVLEKTRILGKIKRVFIPVKPLESEEDDLTRILICSTAADDIRLAQELRDASSGKRALLSAETMRWMQARKSQHTVRGMIDHHLGFGTGIRLEIASRSLKDGFVIIHENQEPGIMPAIGSLIAGGCVALTFLLRFPSLPSLPSRKAIHPFPPHLETPPPLPKK